MPVLPKPSRWLGRFVMIVRVSGDSMVPALHDGDRLLAVRPGPWRSVRHGAIIVGRVPSFAGGDGSSLFIKRVAALGGEVARVPRDRLHPDAEVERFGGTVDGTYATWNIPSGHVFVKGDGFSSADSTSWGAIARRDVIGVVVARLPRHDGATIP